MYKYIKCTGFSTGENGSNLHCVSLKSLQPFHWSAINAPPFPLVTNPLLAVFDWWASYPLPNATTLLVGLIVSRTLIGGHRKNGGFSLIGLIVSRTLIAGRKKRRLLIGRFNCVSDSDWRA